VPRACKYHVKGMTHTELVIALRQVQTGGAILTPPQFRAVSP
jgi:hypothetical protein